MFACKLIKKLNMEKHNPKTLKDTTLQKKSY